MTHTHGMHGTSVYETWKNIRQRCQNPRNPRYPDYGGRGINVHPAWCASFEIFYAYVGDRPAPDMSLDRIDNDGNYEPGNVRWADATTQNRNQRPRQVRTCDQPGCSRKHVAHGLCGTHYSRWYRQHNPRRS